MENEKNIIKQETNNNNGSQINTVSPFANSPQNKKEKEDIKTRIDTTKNRNLNENTKINNLNGLNSTPSSSQGLGSKPSIEDDNGKSGIFNRKKKKSNENTTIGGLSSNTKELSGSRSNKSTSKKGGLGRSLLGGLGSTAANKLSQDSEVGSTMVQTAETGLMGIKAIKWLITFFSTPVGWVVAAIMGILALILLIPIILALIINSLGMKFGLSGEETLEVFNEEYFENLSQEEIEEFMSIADEKMCKQGFLDGIRHIFGMWNIENGDQCELSHYIKHLIETKEKSTKVKPISPGYFMSTLYYAFDSQNRDEDGDLFLNPTDFIENNGSTDEAKEVNDLDAITTIMAAKVYNQDDLIDLLDNYIFYENLSGNNVSIKRADGSYSIVKGYYYRVYVCVTLPDGTKSCSCEDRTSPLSYSIDDKKFKLYLRYGQKVVDEYVNELNENTAYDKTSSKCQIWTKHDLSKYDTMANPDTLEDDGAKISISSGTYGYNNGFIFKTYPKYDTKYSINNEVDYSYKVDKDIEQIVKNIESRQDYTNYLLGYPSNVKTELSISGSAGTNCTYNIDGVDISNIKVKLLHGKSTVPGVNAFDPIEGQELIDFERYVLGVVYGEVGGFSDETLKTQAIAARSYALARVKAMSGLSLTEENGTWILTIRNSNEDQAFCDPDKGCYRCEGYNTIFSGGALPTGASCEVWKPALPQEHKIRSAVKEVEGMILTDENGKPVHASYNATIQRGWEEKAKQGQDYIEILKNHYKGTTVTTNKCTMGTNGWIWPTDSGWTITSKFGHRVPPTPTASDYHAGVDIGGFPKDSPIYAIRSGKVSAKGYHSSMGNYIKVDHGNGYESVYMHMNKHMPGLDIGDEVFGGQQIGYMGTTGDSTGVHLHLGIKLNGKYVNPLEVIGITTTKG